MCHLEGLKDPPRQEPTPVRTLPPADWEEYGEDPWGPRRHPQRTQRKSHAMEPIDNLTDHAFDRLGRSLPVPEPVKVVCHGPAKPAPPELMYADNPYEYFMNMVSVQRARVTQKQRSQG